MSSGVLGNWADSLSRIREEGALYPILRELNTLYADEDIEIYPQKIEVFKVFRMLKPKDLRVVILGLDPYPNPGEATGIAFGNPEESLRMSKSLQKIHEVLEEKFHDGLYLDFDITLESWVQQGIMPLNTSLTVQRGKVGSHLHIWQRFMEMLVVELSLSFKDLIFCLWGKRAQSFSYLIDENKHTILECYHPAYAVRQGKVWECDHFEQINKILKEPIKW
jgi:uracil-DNA glycosylase